MKGICCLASRARLNLPRLQGSRFKAVYELSSVSNERGELEVCASFIPRFLSPSADSESSSDDEKKLPKPKGADFIRLVSSNSSANGLIL